MPLRTGELTERQVEVLRWVADGCVGRDWPDESHKNTARALQSRGLVLVSRKRKVWTASLTDDGRYYVEHDRYPVREPIMDDIYEPDPDPPKGRGRPVEPRPPADATARAMRRVRRRQVERPVKQTQREIKEVYMKYKVVVTRVQVAERFVRATSEDDAAEKVQAEFERPYGYFGSWKTTSSEVDVIEAEQTTVVGPASLSNDGPLLLSLKDGAKALGISYSTLYQLVNQGDIEQVVIGARKFVAREALMAFIVQNTHKGYYRAR